MFFSRNNQTCQWITRPHNLKDMRKRIEEIQDEGKAFNLDRSNVQKLLVFCRAGSISEDTGKGAGLESTSKGRVLNPRNHESLAEEMCNAFVLINVNGLSVVLRV